MAGDLDRARALKAHFERAAAAEQKTIERLQGQKAMADKQGNPPDRTTSAAKHSDPDALSRARSTKEAYESAATGQQKEVARAQEQQTKEQQKHPHQHAPSAQMHNRPQPSPGRKAVDRDIHEKSETKLSDQKLAEARDKKQELERQQELARTQEDKDKEK